MTSNDNLCKSMFQDVISYYKGLKHKEQYFIGTILKMRVCPQYELFELRASMSYQIPGKIRDKAELDQFINDSEEAIIVNWIRNNRKTIDQVMEREVSKHAQ
jgi:hypothetical protein